MREIIFAYAAESCKAPEMLNELRSTIAGNVNIIEPDASFEEKNGTEEWLLKRASTADFIVILFSALNKSDEASLNASHELIEPTLSDSHNKKIGTLVLSSQARDLVRNQAGRLTVIYHSKDRQQLPEDLRGAPCFEFSSAEGREALLCRLVHNPVRATSKVREEAGSAALKVAMGTVATLIGNSDRTKDFLLSQFDEPIAQGVHYCMAILVLFLLFAGFIAVLRLGLNLFRQMFDLHPLQGLPGGPKMWRHIIWGLAAVLVITFAFYFFPRSPNVDENVTKHLQEWRQRLSESQNPNGGIREHLDRGVSQVWCTAQALAALLCSENGSSMQPKNFQRAFSFVDRTRISNLKVKEDQRTELLTKLSEKIKSADFSKLPSEFPTFTLALVAISRLSGETDLKPEGIRFMDQNKYKYFTFSDSDEGWGYFEQFDWGVTEVAAWVAISKIQSLRMKNPPVWETSAQRDETRRNIREIIKLLSKRQLEQVGGFSPIADTSDVGFARTYSTIMATWAIAEASASDLGIYQGSDLDDLCSRMKQAIKWLGTSGPLKEGKGWKVNPADPTDEEPFLGLTAQTLCVINRMPFRIDNQSEKKFVAIKRNLLADSESWIKKKLNSNDRMHDSDTYLYPTQRATESSTFLWYPWCVALLRSFATDPTLTEKQQATATKILKRLRARAGEFGAIVDTEYNYVAAEALIGYSWPMNVQNQMN